jgi:hypothetical protein
MRTTEGKLKASLAEYFAYDESIEGRAEYYEIYRRVSFPA